MRYDQSPIPPFASSELPFTQLQSKTKYKPPACAAHVAVKLQQDGRSLESRRSKLGFRILAHEQPNALEILS